MIKKPNLILIGFMGTGKSTVGRFLAEKLNFAFVDIDEIIKRALGMDISEIFSRFGESRFRDIETEAVKAVAKKKGQVISTGGGVVLREENIVTLKKTGFLFCLTATEDVIFERLKYSKDRPLLQVSDPKSRIKELLLSRMPLYSKADYVIDTSSLSVREVTEIILKKYEELINGKT